MDDVGDKGGSRDQYKGFFQKPGGGGGLDDGELRAIQMHRGDKAQALADGPQVEGRKGKTQGGYPGFSPEQVGGDGLRGPLGSEMLHFCK